MTTSKWQEGAVAPGTVVGGASYHKYVHTSLLSAAGFCFLTCYNDLNSTMGNTPSQNPSPNPVQKTRKIVGKIPGVPAALRDRSKDSKDSASASSSKPALKGARAKDQSNATVTSAGSEPGSAPQPETAPATAERQSEAPAPPPSETVCPHNNAIYRNSNGLLISRFACACLRLFFVSLQTPKAPVTMSGSLLTVPCQVNLFSNYGVPDF